MEGGFRPMDRVGPCPRHGYHPAAMRSQPELSVVVPVLDERGNLEPLHAQIREHVGGWGVLGR